MNRTVHSYRKNITEDGHIQLDKYIKGTTLEWNVMLTNRATQKRELFSIEVEPN